MYQFYFIVFSFSVVIIINHNVCYFQGICVLIADIIFFKLSKFRFF